MPKPVRKMQKAYAAARAAVLPRIAPELLDHLVKGPITAEPPYRLLHIQVCAVESTILDLARDYSISRAAADAFALRSQQRAAAAWQEGRFADEVVPVTVPQGIAAVFERA
jgi:acetyl-CoA C-acetyltransferase